MLELLLLTTMKSGLSHETTGVGLPSATHTTSTKVSVWVSIVGKTVNTGRAVGGRQGEGSVGREGGGGVRREGGGGVGREGGGVHMYVQSSRQGKATTTPFSQENKRSCLRRDSNRR